MTKDKTIERVVWQTAHLSNKTLALKYKATGKNEINLADAKAIVALKLLQAADHEKEYLPNEISTSILGGCVELTYKSQDKITIYSYGFDECGFLKIPKMKEIYN